MFEISNLQAAYGESQVLFGVDLTVEDGEFVAMLGPNGAGKTTIMRCISGQLKPTGGEIEYNGESLVGMSSDKIAQKGIIHVPQEESLFDELTVLDNLRVGSYMKDVRDKREENLELVFDIFPRLEERQDQIAGTLSGGERKMVAVGKGLMAEPNMLLLDEPSAGLAPNLVDLVFDRIEQIREDVGVTVFLVEQRVVESLEVADRAYVLEHGSIEMEGETEDLMERSEIRESYLGM